VTKFQVPYSSNGFEIAALDGKGQISWALSTFYPVKVLFSLTAATTTRESGKQQSALQRV
jgi:hypothetical protein